MHRNHGPRVRGRLTVVVLPSLVALAAVLPRTPLPAQETRPRFELPPRGAMGWYKGNTHAHTTESDGDSPPEVVARWYKEHGYRFLVLSDHDVLTDPGSLRHLVDSTFLLIPGEEVSASFRGKSVHVNGLNLDRVVEPRTGATMVETIQRNVDAVREAEGVPHINHPNFGWAFGAAELAQVEDDRLLEIFNGHPLVHNQGGGGYPGMEAIWDILLTQGMRIYGIAVDDAHHFQEEFSRTRANPGRGWVVVKAPRLEAEAIMEALENGRFYASTGVDLEDVVVTETRLEIRIAARGDFRYTTTFIGVGGRALKTVNGPVATFDLETPEPYVRAVVRDSGGGLAWVQPVFVVGGAPN